ncbi:MAG: acyltransferase family protein [Minwuia sp.]|nr:acyltransferase family protein [Minwuia sp.]
MTLYYRPEIDGLRAVAVVAVILFHAGFETFSGGYVGVDVFFVISGYLIAGIIVADLKAGRFSILHFYERRARRILPALFLVMLACVPFAWLWLLPNDLLDFSQSLAAVSVFASNLLFFQESGYFGTTNDVKPLIHTWSLAVEEQYYVFFPVLLALFWRRTRVIAALLIVIFAGSLAISIYASYKYPEFGFYFIITRAWELLAGSFLAIYSQRLEGIRSNRVACTILGPLGVACIILAVLLFDDETPFPGFYAALPVGGTMLIILFSNPGTLVGKVLGSRAFVGIGLISYSLYLWHQPLFAFLRQKSVDSPDMVALFTAVAAAFALAWGSYRFVERPFRDRNRFSRWQIFAMAAVGSALFLALGVIGHVNRGFPDRVDPRIMVLSMMGSYQLEQQQTACWDRVKQRNIAEAGCPIGATDQKPSFALIGDSHAAAMSVAIDQVARENGLSGRAYTFVSCTPLTGARIPDSLEFSSDCNWLRGQIFDTLLPGETLPDTLIVSARWPWYVLGWPSDNGEGGREKGPGWKWLPDDTASDYTAAMTAVYQNSIRAMLDSGRKVILVYPVPEMSWQVPKRLVKAHVANGELAPDDGSISHASFLERSTPAIAALDGIGEHENLVRIRPDRMFCDSLLPGRCVAHIARDPVYLDDDHLSDFGSAIVAKEIFSHIRSK